MTTRAVAVAAALCAGALVALPAHALTIAEAYRAALGFDAQYLAARHELESTRQEIPIARASLLPSVTLNAGASQVGGTREFANSQSQTVTLPLDYTSPQASLQMRTPLFNYEALSRVRQVNASVDAAEATFRARHIDLASRLVTVYLQVAAALDTQQLALWEVEALNGQLTRSRQRHTRGEGTLLEVARTESALELARAKVLEAGDAVLVGQRALRRVIGIDASRLFKPTFEFKVQPLFPERIQEWMDIALRQNPVVQSRQFALEAARRGIDRARAGHMPRADFVAGISQQRNESPTNVGQTSTLKSVGVQISVPIYNGGGVDATVRQAISERDKFEENLRADRETVLLDIERYYRVVSSAPGKLLAYDRAVQAAQTELRGALRAQELGMGTVADVLDARTRYNTAVRDLGQARLDYLENRFKLMMTAGMPIEGAIEDLTQVLIAESRISSPGAK